MPMMRFRFPLSCALPPDAGGNAGSRDTGLTAPMMDATYKMLAALDEMSKAARAAPPLGSIDPAAAAAATVRDDASAPAATLPAAMADARAHTRRRRYTGLERDFARASKTDPFLTEFDAEIDERKTQNLASIELTGYDKDDEERVLALLEQLKLYMVARGLDARLFELKAKTLALWDDKRKHWSVNIRYVFAEEDGDSNAAAPAVRGDRASAAAAAAPTPAATAAATAAAMAAPIVNHGNRRGQSYAILEEVASRAATTVPSATLPVDLSTVERRSLDIIAFDVKKSFGDDASEITLVGYARNSAEAVRPKLEKMADYLADTKGLKRDSIKLDPRRLDPARDKGGVWDRRVEIDVRDPSLAPKFKGAPPSAAA